MKTDEEWEARFGETVDAPDGGTMWSKDEATFAALSELDQATVWSVYETENESLLLVPGIHAVNIVGYVVSERPITQAEIDSGEWIETMWVDGDEIERLPRA